MNYLKMTCDKCRVASTCPSKGSSPVLDARGRVKAFCLIIDGYARDPVNPAILSEASKARAAVDGPCLTLAEVPNSTGGRDIVKIFSHPIRHDRESTTEILDRIVPKSSNPT